MSAPLDEDGFHPDDPTKWLWKRLLRHKPAYEGRKRKTKSERNRIGKTARNYWLEHPHPRKGKPFRNK